MINKNKQQGAVLFVAIILLLVITIIGVSAVNSSGIKTQVAGNSMFSMLVYQGAESALARTASNSDLSNLKSALASSTSRITVPTAYLPAENIAAGGTLTSTADVEYLGLYDCPSTGSALSTLMKCKIFDIDALSRLRATNAKDRHIKGLGVVSP